MKWEVGRAGMLYRDLIPGRVDGQVIASHIRIPDGGPVGDWVHYHHVQFQMIYCHRGWVKVVYEDQGEPFVMRPGDCVLQPPEIRHQVLECSDGMEVVEVAVPADYETKADPDLELPNASTGKTFAQPFVRSWREIADATDGFAVVNVGTVDAVADVFRFIYRLDDDEAFTVPAGVPFTESGQLLEVRISSVCSPSSGT